MKKTLLIGASLLFLNVHTASANTPHYVTSSDDTGSTMEQTVQPESNWEGTEDENASPSDNVQPTQSPHANYFDKNWRTEHTANSSWTTDQPAGDGQTHWQTQPKTNPVGWTKASESAQAGHHTDHVTLQFAPRTTQLSTKQVHLLQKWAQEHHKDPTWKVSIQCHGNPQKTNSKHATWTQQRIESISAVLEKQGIASERIESKSTGATWSKVSQNSAWANEVSLSWTPGK
jgi:outer membrane protein OmpA-like peptidoglycan-associated protein